MPKIVASKTRRSGRIARLIGWTTNLALLVLAGLTIAALLARLGWPIDPLCHFRVQYSALAALVVLACLVVRRWKASLIATGLAAVNAIPVIAACWPGTGPTSIGHQARPIRVLHLNLEAGNDGHARVIEFIGAENPDVLMLVEMTPLWCDALKPLRAEYPYSVIFSGEYPRDSNGIGLLSRTPLSNTLAGFIEDEWAPNVVATLKWEGKVLTLVGTHPYPARSRDLDFGQRLQFQVIGSLITKTEGPVVLFGDLNTTAWSPLFQDFLSRSGLRDSGTGHLPRPTWRANNPLLGIPIDHCLVSPGVVIHHRRVGPDVGSEHRPLIVDFSLPLSQTRHFDGRQPTRTLTRREHVSHGK